MGIDFYAGSGSPFAWRVWLALEHKQLPYELKMLSFSAGDTRKPEFVALNPRHKVPTIVDDGFVLYESSAVVEYLEERYPERPLFPRDVRDRATARKLVAEATEYLYLAGRPLGANLFAKKEPDWNLEEIAKAKAATLAECDYFAGQLRGEFFFGGQPGAVDYTIYPLLATCPRYERKKPDLGLVAAIPPKLRDWMKRVESLPYFDKTYPPHWR